MYDAEGYPQPVINTPGIGYVFCYCPYPVAGPGAKMLPIKLTPGKSRYKFHCLGCGLTGEYYNSGRYKMEGEYEYGYRQASQSDAI